MPPPRPRSVVERMAGYTPGEQPGPGERVVKLNTNENPFPPSPRVLEAIRGVTPETLRRYPSSMSDEFRAVAARNHGVSPDSILAGNGSDDILQIALRTYCGPGDAIVCPDPTYSLYPVLAELADVRLIPVPWKPGWRLPAEALLNERGRAIFFANPNSPSGTAVPVGEIEALAERTEALVLVDEAYADFADDNCLELPARRPNVLVTRTLSKGYGLAGLRFGYAVGDPAVIAQMAKVKDSYNCDAIAIAAACAALDDAEYARGRWQAIRAERARLSAELERRRFVVIPSQANFLLVTAPDQLHTGWLYAALKERGVLVRFFDRPGLDNRLRITVGARQENDTLLEALDAALGLERPRSADVPS
ncbi:MAG: histidinol-phosphate transaminase [Acidobacteriota bacterium]